MLPRGSEYGVLFLMIYLYCMFLVIPNTLLQCFLCLRYRQHQIDWGNRLNDSFVIFVVVIHGYPHDMASKFAVHQTLFQSCIYVHPHFSYWAMFNLDLPIVNFFFDAEILHLDMLCSFCTTCFTICFQQDCTHIVLI
jgi:hypothetical protein